MPTARHVLWLLALLLGSQTGSAQEPTRASQIEAARREKARNLRPPTKNTVEKGLDWVDDHDLLKRLTAGVAGVRARLGGLPPGSGLAIGPEYYRPDLDEGNIRLRLQAIGSSRKYEWLRGNLLFPHLANDHVELSLDAIYRNYPSMDYYGPGPNSKKTGRSDYRLERADFGFISAVKPVKYLRLGGSGSAVRLNVGPGQDNRFVSAAQIYTEAQTPGIQQQSDFLRGGVFADIDYRDNPGGPRSGGYYRAQWNYFRDQDYNRFNFRQLDAEAQQYIPLFNERRVIALRGLTSLTYTNRNQQVPFYLQPVLGGSEDLRGFRQFRFYDDNLLVLNGEYRWEAFSGLDMALFVDAGKVFPRHSQFNVHDLETDYGFGFRFNVRNDVFCRLDVGFSREGFQLWLKFNNVFAWPPRY